MSTVTEDIQRLTKDSQLYKFKARLRARQQEHRLIYISLQTLKWLNEELKTATSDQFIHGAATPKEQLDTLTRRYCSGEELNPPLPHLMNPTKDGIWRLITADLRIVGWFVQRGVFIVSEIELKKNCDNLRDNQLMQNARETRTLLNINSGQFLSGGLNECI
jgi:hypothetical protein